MPRASLSVAIVVKNALKRYFIYQWDDKAKKVNQDEGVPVHQLDRLAGQVPLHMGDEVIKIENVLGAAFIKINTALRAVL